MNAYEAARRFACFGWATFPVTQAKLPFPGSHGHLDATCDEQELAGLFEGRHGAGLALACGGPSGVLAVDVDEKSGRSGSAHLAGLGLCLEPTLTARTRNGGRHHFYRMMAMARSKNDLFGGECGVDVKAEGGYVVIWPTEGYRFEAKVTAWAGALPPPPSWAVVRKRVVPMGRSTESMLVRTEKVADLYGMLDSCAERLAATPGGSRNDELNKLAFGLGQLVSMGMVSRREVIDKLSEAARMAGLSGREIGWTLTSALRGTEETG